MDAGRVRLLPALSTTGEGVSIPGHHQLWFLPDRTSPRGIGSVDGACLSLTQMGCWGYHHFSVDALMDVQGVVGGV
jgi:hypothetical protein